MNGWVLGASIVAFVVVVAMILCAVMVDGDD